MKLVICAGPATTGKTSVLRHIIRKLLEAGERAAFLKIDVQYAEEDEQLAQEFGIPTRKVYSGELCPDHCNVMVLGDALHWARKADCDVLLVETAGLCLRCSPYVDGGLGMVVLEATSGMNLPLKVGPMLSLADVAVVTKIDRVSQAEREVFRARIQDVRPVRPDPRGECAVRHRHRSARRARSCALRRRAASHLLLRGNPPVGTCTICVGKKEIGWQSHFGVVRPLENQTFYRGSEMPERTRFDKEECSMNVTVDDLPGLDCGVCGFRTCAALADRLLIEPELVKRCIHLSSDQRGRAAASCGAGRGG